MDESGEIPAGVGKMDIEPKIDNPVQFVGEERLVSNSEITRAIHATNKEIADTVLVEGLMIDSKMGFAGVAVGLGTDRDRNLREVKNTHRNLPVVVFLAYPNIHKDAVSLKESGELPREFAEETLFSEGEISQENLSGIQKTDTYFDNELIEGYYDKEKDEWVDNPNYWERKIEQEAQQENLNSEELSRRKTERLVAIRQKAIDRLKAESKKYQEEQLGEVDEWWKDLPQDDEVKIL